MIQLFELKREHINSISWKKSDSIFYFNILNSNYNIYILIVYFIVNFKDINVLKI